MSCAVLCAVLCAVSCAMVGGERGTGVEAFAEVVRLLPEKRGDEDRGPRHKVSYLDFSPLASH